MTGATNEIKIKRLRGEAGSPEFQPEKALIGLFLTGEGRNDFTLAPGERFPLPTGIALELPEGIEGQITISGPLAELSSIMLPNSPGTIDPDYRGEVFVIAQNTSGVPVTLRYGSHIADMRLRRFVQATFVQVDSLDESKRGNGGLGSTGV
ncbi:dUTP diphosphatase [Ascidiaceihabitans sp.]|uniref:dUTP diphosphatase n=1 Tax=Ascidiaceihabitans sp. TaxID=1872644 RepID=UPI00329A1DB0